MAGTLEVVVDSPSAEDEEYTMVRWGNCSAQVWLVVH